MSFLMGQEGPWRVMLSTSVHRLPHSSVSTETNPGLPDMLERMGPASLPAARPAQGGCRLERGLFPREGSLHQGAAQDLVELRFLRQLLCPPLLGAPARRMWFAQPAEGGRKDLQTSQLPGCAPDLANEWRLLRRHEEGSVSQRPVTKSEVCCLPGSQTVLFLLIMKTQSLLKSSECDHKKRKYTYPLALSYFVQSLPLEQVRLTHAVCPRIPAPPWGSCPPKSAVPIPMHLYSFVVYVYTLHAVLLCVFFSYCGEICVI